MKCVVCGIKLTEANNKDGDIICDRCEMTKDELSNGIGYIEPEEGDTNE